jgi:hypothetical protein
LLRISVFLPFGLYPFDTELSRKTPAAAFQNSAHEGTVIDPMGAARQKWSLTQEAFDGLLAALDSDRDTAADRYLEIRRNLVRLFEWRGCSTPDEYADETLNRCAKKIAEGEAIRDLPTYSIGVARMLLREITRERSRETLPLKDAPEPRTLPPEPPGSEEGRLECLRAVHESALTGKSRSNPQLLQGR